MGAFDSVAVADTLEPVSCYKCAILFGMPRNFLAKRREDQGIFFCPNGHEQYFTVSLSSQLKAQLEAKEKELARTRADLGERLSRESQRANLADTLAAQAKRSARRAKNETSKLKQRARGGLCPCCKRSFTTLARHMKTKHPAFGAKKGKA